MTRWPDVRAIDWSRLPGAYGTQPDVLLALETMRTATRSDDDFGNAWNDVLCGHVLHQGTRGHPIAISTRAPEHPTG